MSKIKDFKYYFNEQITIDDYMHMYYNFKKGSFISLTHRDIKNYFPFIKRKKFETVTRENILKGEILLVKDYKGEILAYQSPLVNEKKEYDNNLCRDNYKEYLSINEEQLECYLNNIKDNQKLDIIIDLENNIEKLTELTEENLEKMNCYQLAQLKKTLEKANNQKLNRLVQKELYFRKGTEHGNKKSKIRKLIKKERRIDLNDKY